MQTTIETHELNWFIVNSVLAGAAVAGFVVRAGRQLLVPAVPEAALFGAGLFAIMMLIYPIVSVSARQRRGHGLGLTRHALASALGGLVAGLLHLLLS